MNLLLMNGRPAPSPEPQPDVPRNTSIGAKFAKVQYRTKSMFTVWNIRNNSQSQSYRMRAVVPYEFSKIVYALSCHLRLSNMHTAFQNTSNGELKTLQRGEEKWRTAAQWPD